MDSARALIDRVVAVVAAGDDVRAGEIFSEVFSDSAQVVVRDHDHERLTTSVPVALRAVMVAFSDLSYSSVSRGVGEARGDDAVLSGVHRAPFLGCPPTGRRVYLNVHVSGHEEGGRLTGLQVVTNVAALMHQLQGGGDATAVADAMTAEVRHRLWSGPPAEFELGAPSPPDSPPARRRRSGRIAVWVTAALAVLLLAGAGLVLLPRLSGGGQNAASSPASLASVGPPTAVPAPTLTAPTTSTPPPTSTSSAPSPPAIVTPTGPPQVQAGRQLVLPSDVLFGLDSAQLSPQTQSALSDLAQQILAAHVTGQIQVNGYTDNLGSAQHGLELSRQRALAVAQALQAALGNAPVTLLPQGFGDADPIADNATDQGRARNRRVTIVLPATPS